MPRLVPKPAPRLVNKVRNFSCETSVLKAKPQVGPVFPPIKTDVKPAPKKRVRNLVS